MTANQRIILLFYIIATGLTLTQFSYGPKCVWKNIIDPSKRGLNYKS